VRRAALGDIPIPFAFRLHRREQSTFIFFAGLGNSNSIVAAVPFEESEWSICAL
jgi:hypothetical protein